MISSTPASALLTGQPAFAAPAISWKVASSIPGTTPTVVRAIFVIFGPSSWRRRVTTASVVTDVGTCPASLSAALKRHREAGGVGGGDELLGVRARRILNRVLNEKSPLMLSPAVNVPLPPFRSHSTARGPLPAWVHRLVCRAAGLSDGPPQVRELWTALARDPTREARAPGTIARNVRTTPVMPGAGQSVWRPRIETKRVRRPRSSSVSGASVSTRRVIGPRSCAHLRAASVNCGATQISGSEAACARDGLLLRLVRGPRCA